MKLISHNIFLKHDLSDHPERAERLRKALKLFEYEEADDGEKYLSKVHTPAYISRVKRATESANQSPTYLDAGETYVTKHTYKAACYAVGAAVTAAQYAANKQNAFALVRPPGHHAHPDWTNGFCIFNNIAIASVMLVERKEKVLIVDIDMHRGDGTSDVVRQFNPKLENRLYYFSINQYGVFPGITIDEGNVKNIYVKAGTSENEYIAILKRELPAVIRNFKPSIIAISAGFDSFARDRDVHSHDLGCGLSLTKRTINELKNIIGKKPYFAVLEGGYDPDSVIEGVAAFLGIDVEIPSEPKKKEVEKTPDKIELVFLDTIKEMPNSTKKRPAKKKSKAVSKAKAKRKAAKKKPAQKKTKPKKKTSKKPKARAKKK